MKITQKIAQNIAGYGYVFLILFQIHSVADKDRGCYLNMPSPLLYIAVEGDSCITIY